MKIPCKTTTGASVRIINLAKGLAATGNNVNVILPKHHASTEFVDKTPVHELSGLCPNSILRVIGKIGSARSLSSEGRYCSDRKACFKHPTYSLHTKR
jgi:hypothetical protein